MSQLAGRWPWSTNDRVDNTWTIAELTAGSEARYRLRTAISAYPTCVRRPVEGVPVVISPCRLVWKTRMGWLSDGEKNFEDMFTRFDMIHKRDGQTRQAHTQTPHDGIGRAYA